MCVRHVNGLKTLIHPQEIYIVIRHTHLYGNQSSRDIIEYSEEDRRHEHVDEKMTGRFEFTIWEKKVI